MKQIWIMIIGFVCVILFITKFSGTDDIVVQNDVSSSTVSSTPNRTQVTYSALYNTYQTISKITTSTVTAEVSITETTTSTTTTTAKPITTIQLVVSPTPTPTPDIYTGGRNTELELEIMEAYNKWRQVNGLQISTRYSTTNPGHPCVTGALIRLKKLMWTDTFSHDGYLVAYRSQGCAGSLGENLATGFTGLSAGYKIVTAWENSPSHLENLRKSNPLVDVVCAAPNNLKFTKIRPTLNGNTINEVNSKTNLCVMVYSF